MLTNIISGCCSEPAGRLSWSGVLQLNSIAKLNIMNTPFLSNYRHIFTISREINEPTNDASQPKLSEKTMPSRATKPRAWCHKPNSASTRERPFPAQRAACIQHPAKAPMERDSELDQPAPISLRCDRARFQRSARRFDGDHIDKARHCRN